MDVYYEIYVRVEANRVRVEEEEKPDLNPDWNQDRFGENDEALHHHHPHRHDIKGDADDWLTMEAVACDLSCLLHFYYTRTEVETPYGPV